MKSMSDNRLIIIRGWVCPATSITRVSELLDDIVMAPLKGLPSERTYPCKVTPHH
jgi:hypothetical protein